MTNSWQVVIVTSGGTYRAFHASSTSICITEDGVDGVQDVVEVDPDGLSLSPELLVKELKHWLHERVRGVELLEVHLSMRNG